MSLLLISLLPIYIFAFSPNVSVPVNHECAALMLSKDSLAFQSSFHKTGMIQIFAASNAENDEHYNIDTLLFTLTFFPTSKPVVISANTAPYVLVAYDVLKLKYTLDSNTVSDLRSGIKYFRPQCRDMLHPTYFPLDKIGILAYACESTDHPVCETVEYPLKLDLVHVKSAVDNVLHLKFEKEALVVRKRREFIASVCKYVSV